MQLDPEVLPVTRPLYAHQEEALRKAARKRNLVIATGTGSGKTECYLLPIIDTLLREDDAGTLSRPGVRAMLLYPMNALANDQMQRIRGLLEPFHKITFGRYIGATPESLAEGQEQHRLETGLDPDLNELVSREQMRERPPHILLTNYSMLEYLLLRPRDTAFFDGSTGHHWRHVVLDELHVYNGTKGAEIAMLLRRLRDRVNGSERGRLQFFGTSATLGTSPGAPERIAQFASDLSDETLEYRDNDADHQDVITPQLENPADGTPARFHYMLRALEGAFICKSPQHPAGTPRLRLERARVCPACRESGIRSQMFELGVCIRCSAEFLVGAASEPDEHGHQHVQQSVDGNFNLTYLLVATAGEVDDEDEAATVDDDDVHADQDLRRLCTACGCLLALTDTRCRCGESTSLLLAVTCAKPKPGKPLRRCPACSGRTPAEIVLRFFTGNDAPVSVIATALYQA